MVFRIIHEIIRRWGVFFSLGYAVDEMTQFVWGICGFVLIIFGVIIIYRRGANYV